MRITIMRKTMLFALLVMALTACTGTPVATARMVPTRTPVPPTATPLPPTPIPTATLSPTPIKLEMAYRDCPRQEVSFGQSMLIAEDFQFDSRNIARWFTGHGVETITIDGYPPITLKDPALWSPITLKDLGKYGKFYATTFSWDLPALDIGAHRIDIEFSVPDLYGKRILFLYCTGVTVLPR